MSETLKWHFGDTYHAALEQVHTYHAALLKTLAMLSLETCAQVTQEILAVHERGARLFVFGNGGSAATASHMACDLGKNTAVDGLPRLHIHSLTDNVPLITALANDFGYESIFSEQLLLSSINSNDVVIAISGSGHSPNVLAGVATARSVGARSIAITGRDGGQLADLADVTLIVQSMCMEIIEDMHLAINHIITTSVGRALATRAAEQDALFNEDANESYPLLEIAPRM